MKSVSGKSRPPFWGVVLLLSLLYTTVSVVLAWAFGLPWHLRVPRAFGLTVGILSLGAGFGIYVWANRSLGLKRALGKELFKAAAESTLVTAGPYAHVRNPIYLSVILLLLGAFLVSRSTPVALLTVFALAHCMIVAKWEEKELTNRFGERYRDYKKRVPFLIPSLRPLFAESPVGSPPAQFANARCPITETAIDSPKVTESLTRTCRGKTIAFCCAACLDKWDQLSETQRADKLRKVTPGHA